MRLFRRREDPGTLLIVGLGNHERRYQHNRHNVGFMVVDHLAQTWGETIGKKQSRSLISTCKFGDARIILAKPQTYMNESGRAIQALLSYYKLRPHQMLVIFDDLDLPLGTIRMRPAGGTGGHRGMRSIQNGIKTQEYPRMRVGIGRPPGRMDPADYVLEDFKADELDVLATTLDRSVACLIRYLENGIDDAMNECNTPTQTP